ncbi:hypothetical protein HGM15179_019996 [Zosterops borbonicus]|uniref:Uncharacterized protein n=1 Tax=Zosterops borbonicus TaxID=364589 RepID=A0A8K1DA01_9PASS|nr:hypothetical protein HGM15179_019996 [Zosterops borbonicus]
MENPEWFGVWEEIGQTLKEFSDMIAWNFPPEQIQNPAEVGKYLKDNCNDNCNEKKLVAMCRALTNSYCTLLDTVGQQIKPEGQEDESADTSVTQAAAKRGGEPKPIAIAPVQRRKQKTKSICPVDDDGEPGSSQPAGESEPEIITESLSIESLQSLRKDYTRWPDESILSWLVQIWDSIGNSIIPDDTEARHLGSLSHNVGIDQGMTRGPKALTH